MNKHKKGALSNMVTYVLNSVNLFLRSSKSKLCTSECMSLSDIECQSNSMAVKFSLPTKCKYDIFTLSFAFLMIISLGGCGLYGKYHRPDITAEGLIRDAVSDTDTLVYDGEDNFANIPWRSVFTDPKLQELIEIGLENNPNLLNAALNVKMAKAQLTASRLAFLPSFAFSGNGALGWWDFGTPAKTYSLPINASWNIDLFGNLLSQSRSSQVALLQMKDYQVSVQTSLIANIANLYYTLLMLDKQLALVDDMEKLTKDTWQIMSVQKDAVLGVRSTAVQSAESNYYSVLTQKEDLKRQVRETENTLSLLLGHQASAISRSSIEEQSLPETFSVGVGLELLSNRSDVHAAEMALAQCFYDVETARSRFYPGINIAGSGAFTNSSGSIIVNPGKWLFSLVGSLTQPIFQNGQLVAGLKVAKAQYEQAYNNWQNSVLSAGSEVSNALVLYNSSVAKSQIEEKQIEILKQNVEDTKALMASAGSTYLEVITAQSTLLNVELSKVADDFYKMQAIVNLYYALGGGAK